MEIFEFGVFFCYFWVDYWLLWEFFKYGGIIMVYILVVFVWKFDIVFINRYCVVSLDKLVFVLIV